MKKPRNEPDPEMLDEYDFSGGVRGKYIDRFLKGSNVVVLEPDVAQVFTDFESVNHGCVPPCLIELKPLTFEILQVLNASSIEV